MTNEGREEQILVSVFLSSPPTPHLSHADAETDSVSMKKYDAIEDDDNSHLTFTNLLSREMGQEEGNEKKDGQMRGSGR